MILAPLRPFPMNLQLSFYNSLLSSVPRNFLRMLLLLIKSSSFSGARLPLLIRPCRRLDSFSAYSLLAPIFVKALT